MSTSTIVTMVCAVSSTTHAATDGGSGTGTRSATVTWRVQTLPHTLCVQMETLDSEPSALRAVPSYDLQHDRHAPPWVPLTLLTNFVSFASAISACTTLTVQLDSKYPPTSLPKASNCGKRAFSHVQHCSLVPDDEVDGSMGWFYG